MKNIKIIADSSCDIFEAPNVDFEAVPLKIIASDREYTDNAELDVKAMLDRLYAKREKASTSCPNTEEWLSAFGNAEEVYCLTITSQLSGSYNAAYAAKQIYEEQNPGKRVFVLDSLSTGPEMVFIIEKLAELTAENLSFNEICEKIKEYRNKTGLLFVLESMKNLANNGRISHLSAKMAGIMGIRAVGRAGAVGNLEQLGKYRGEERALEAVADYMTDMGFTGGRVKISHCFNSAAAQSLKGLLERKFSNISTEIYSCGGLCGFYAEMGGLLIGFERE